MKALKTLFILLAALMMIFSCSMESSISGSSSGGSGGSSSSSVSNDIDGADEDTTDSETSDGKLTIIESFDYTLNAEDNKITIDGDITEKLDVDFIVNIESTDNYYTITIMNIQNRT